MILTQFEKLYAGMMEIQSKSTEGLDSTLQGLKENVDAAGGERYNEARKESKEADIAAYGGALGDKLAELSAISGEVQAYGENLRDQFQREALEAVLTGTLDKEATVFSEEDAAKLEELSQKFSEANQAYESGSLEAGQKMVDFREEAEALATAAYESSEWAQKQVDMQVEQIDATRELTKAMVSATDAWRMNNAFSKGGAAGAAFTYTTAVDERTGAVSYVDKYGQTVDGQRDGTGDVYVTLELRQYRELQEESTEVNQDTGNLSRAAPQEKKEEGSYTVVKGDTLWGICRRTYGDGALAWKLAEANGIKNANLIFPGQVVKLPDKGSL